MKYYLYTFINSAIHKLMLTNQSALLRNWGSRDRGLTLLHSPCITCL